MVWERRRQQMTMCGSPFRTDGVARQIRENQGGKLSQAYNGERAQRPNSLVASEKAGLAEGAAGGSPTLFLPQNSREKKAELRVLI